MDSRLYSIGIRLTCIFFVGLALLAINEIFNSGVEEILFMIGKTTAVLSFFGVAWVLCINLYDS